MHSDRARTRETRRHAKIAVLMLLFSIGGVVRGQVCNAYWTCPSAIPGAPGPSPSDLEVFDDGTGIAIYMVTEAGNGNPPGWRWRNNNWQNISDGLGTRATDLIVLTEDGHRRLYATRLDTVGGQTVVTCRRWNGTQWEPGPAGLCTTNYRPVLSADLGDGVRTYGWYGPNSSSPHLAQVNVWNGASWSVIGDTNTVNPAALVVFDDGSGPALYAASSFTLINGVQSRGFAKWRNGVWTSVGEEWFGGAGATMKVFDDGTGPAIFMTFAGTTSSALGQQHIAKWDGLSWSGVGGGLSSPNGFFGVQCLESFDDGSGPALYVGGVFTQAGTLPVRNLARWNGQAWNTVGWGSGAIVEKMAVINEGPDRSLFIGGSFVNVGGGVSPDTARWVGCPNCYANCDGSDGSPRLTANDFACFANRYVKRDPYANCTVDEVVNAADFVCFLNKYVAGCP